MLKESFELKKGGQNMTGYSSCRNKTATPSCAMRQSITGEISDRIKTGQNFYNVIKQ